MPYYDYECTKCRRKFEIEQKISDPPRKRCPHCRGKVFRVITGGGGVILKGNGFYVTDYRSSEYKKQAAADKAPMAPSASSTSDKKKTGTGN
jgi:putative FmdB family regulatory protein